MFVRFDSLTEFVALHVNHSPDTTLLQGVRVSTDIWVVQPGGQQILIDHAGQDVTKYVIKATPTIPCIVQIFDFRLIRMGGELGSSKEYINPVRSKRIWILR